MFNNFGFGEIAVLAFAGLMIFGPERLPKAALDAARIVRRLRTMADGAVTDFKAELPPELADLRTLDPRSLIADALSDRGPTSSPSPVPAPSPAQPGEGGTAREGSAPRPG
jgi:sec-independent protein translocase protein TatB